MNAIAAYKEAKGLTLDQLALRLGLKSKGHVSLLVRGERPINVKIAKKLAPLVGKPWHELVDG